MTTAVSPKHIVTDCTQHIHSRHTIVQLQILEDLDKTIVDRQVQSTTEDFSYSYLRP